MKVIFVSRKLGRLSITVVKLNWVSQRKHLNIFKLLLMRPIGSQCSDDNQSNNIVGGSGTCDNSDAQPWRSGPARIWYDQSGIGREFNYGFKLKQVLKMINFCRSYNDLIIVIRFRVLVLIYIDRVG